MLDVAGTGPRGCLASLAEGVLLQYPAAGADGRPAGARQNLVLETGFVGSWLLDATVAPLAQGAVGGRPPSAVRENGNV